MRYKRRSKLSVVMANLPDAMLQRGREARRAISWREGSHLQVTAGDASCRQHVRWSLYLAGLGVFMGGAAALLSESVREHIFAALAGGLL
jgi:hypothetical protein